jgi:hypothetical protein
MKRTIAVGLICAALGVGVGAWAQKPAAKAPNPKLMNALGNLEAGLQDMGGAPTDPSGHLKKAVDYTRKATDELREAMGMSHHAHSHDEK